MVHAKCKQAPCSLFVSLRIRSARNHQSCHVHNQYSYSDIFVTYPQRLLYDCWPSIVISKLNIANQPFRISFLLLTHGASLLPTDCVLRATQPIVAGGGGGRVSGAAHPGRLRLDHQRCRLRRINVSNYPINIHQRRF